MSKAHDRAVASRLIQRARKGVEHLRKRGADVGDLEARLATARDEMAAHRYLQAQMLAEEANVIANALRFLTAARPPAAVSGKPSPKLLKALSAEIKGRIKEFLAGSGLEKKVRLLARDTVGTALEKERPRFAKAALRSAKEESSAACGQLAAKLNIDGRLAGLLDGKELAKRISSAIEEAVSPLLNEAQVGALIQDAIRRTMYSRELTDLIREVGSKLLE
ncbi:MAG: hypothetical protein ACYTGB_12115, partial [Planctomycetota bacterium]